MTQDSADLIAQHAVLIQPWLNFLDSLEAEQERLQQEMRATEVIVPLEDGAGAVEVVPDPPAVPDEADPVAWLRGQPTTPPEAATVVAAPEQAAPEAGVWAEMVADFEPAAPPVAVVPSGGERAAARVLPATTGAAGEEATVLPSAQTEGTGQAPAAPPPVAAPSATPTAGNSHDAVRGMFEGDFGGDVSQEFERALAETDEAQLPYSVQEAMQYGQEPEDVAAAFVRSARAGELPDRLGAAVEQMEEVDFHFRDVGQRLDSPTTDDDPEAWF